MNPLNTSDRPRTIAAHFRNPETAERAITALTEAGIPRDDIGVALWDNDLNNNDLNSNDASTTRKTGWAERFRSMFSPSERQEYTSHDGLSVLHDMGLEGQEATRYQHVLREGGVLVTVNTRGTNQGKIRAILDRNGALPADERSTSRIAENIATEAGTQRIELLGEMLRVHKERVQRGAVTLKKEVVSERQHQEIPVVREELVIERHPVEGSREATGRDFEDGKEITIPLTEEQVRVEKRPVVREAVDVGKRQVQEVRNISEEVHREELLVEGDEDLRTDQPKRKRA